MLTGVIRGMHDRALQICDNTSKQPEMEHLPECLKPTGQEDPIAKPGRKQKHEQSADEEPQRTLHVPYVWGLSKKIEKTCAPLNWGESGLQASEHPETAACKSEAEDAIREEDGSGLPGSLQGLQ